LSCLDDDQIIHLCKSRAHSSSEAGGAKAHPRQEQRAEGVGVGLLDHIPHLAQRFLVLKQRRKIQRINSTFTENTSTGGI